MFAVKVNNNWMVISSKWCFALLLKVPCLLVYYSYSSHGSITSKEIVLPKTQQPIATNLDRSHDQLKADRDHLCYACQWPIVVVDEVGSTVLYCPLHPQQLLAIGKRNTDDLYLRLGDTGSSSPKGTSHHILDHQQPHYILMDHYSYILPTTTCTGSFHGQNILSPFCRTYNIPFFLSQSAAGIAYLDKPSSQHPYTPSGHSYRTIWLLTIN